MNVEAQAQTLTLHIGTEKTGTTTLQYLFRENAAALAASGLLFPRSILAPGMKSHLSLVHFARGEKSGRDKDHERLRSIGTDAYRAEVLNALRQEIATSGCSHVLLSSEQLSTDLGTAEDVAALTAPLSELAQNIQVVVYLRPQYELYPSAFSTRVKSGNTKPVRPIELMPLHIYDYDVLLGLWEKAPGVTSIAVRRFSRAAFTNGDLIDDFCATIGFVLPPGLERPPRELNTRLDFGAIEFLRMVNGLEGETSLPDKIRRRLVRQLAKTSTHHTLPMPAATLQQLDERSRESNARVAARYFPTLREPLFAPFIADKADPPECLSAEEAVAIAARVLRQRRQGAGQRRKGRHAE